MMRAYIFDKRRQPEPLLLREIEKPVPGEGEVLVKIQAVSINAADYRSMKLGIIPKGRIFGADIAGRIETAGKNTSLFEPGEAVLADLASVGFGGFAEYAAVPEKALTPKPESLTFEQAAALPMAAVTALQGLRDSGCVQAGQQVLIYGAGGGVGTFAVQLARHLGAQVSAVCGTRNVDLVKSLGAAQVIDYTREDALKRGQRYDLILAVNGSRALRDYLRALKPKGKLVIVGGSLSQVVKSILLGTFLSLGEKKIRTLAAKPSPSDLAWIAGLAAEGKIKAVIDRLFPFEELPAAVRYLNEGHASGKVVIRVV